MPPLPKDAALRQRRNRTSTNTKLNTDARVRAPKLPPRATPWHPLTVSWWRDIWRSPMAPEFLKSDIHGLYVLADLVDRYWTEPTTSLAAEIRLQRQCFGLTPIDRRRLQWEIAKGEDAQRRSAANRPPTQPVEDPRLRLIKD